MIILTHTRSAYNVFLDARQALSIGDNKGGKILAVDLSGNVKGEVHLAGKEEQSAPAYPLFRDPDALVFTDLRTAGILDALPGRPKHHSSIYEVTVSEILKCAGVPMGTVTWRLCPDLKRCCSTTTIRSPLCPGLLNRVSRGFHQVWRVRDSFPGQCSRPFSPGLHCMSRASPCRHKENLPCPL